MNYKERCEKSEQNPYNPFGHPGGFWKCPRCGATGDDWVAAEGYTPNCPKCGFAFPDWVYKKEDKK